MTTAVRAETGARLRLRPGVFLATDRDRLILFRRRPWYRSESFGAPSAAKRAVLTRLTEEPAPAADLEALETGFVAALRAGGWLVTTVHWAGRDLYSLQPVDSGAGPAATGPAETLSRFAVLRREGDQMVAESPLARARLVIHDPAVTAVVADLARADAPWAPALLEDLARVGLAGPRAQDDDPALRLWNPPDLWLHGRSRLGNGGYAGAGFGRTGWAAPFVEPAAEPDGDGPVVQLDRPDLAALARDDRPLAAVLEDRRSIRVYDHDHPITIRQLGELLYRCAAERRRGPDRIGRPYPAGGGMYELELYPVVRHVDGLAPGMYHYRPHTHQLGLVRGPGPQVDRLLQGARWSSMAPAEPQVLIVLAARFGRLSSMYEQLAYSLILKHVGVLYQTLYLVATAMGLAPCGLGAGDASAFTDATGLDYPAESSVGEFMLGSRPATDGEK